MVVNSQDLKREKYSGDVNWLFGSKIDTILYFILFLTIEIVFLNRSLQIICGPILAVLFAYLYFVKKDTLLVTLFIIIANDALGTVLLGNLSFQYLLMVFVIYELFCRKKIRIRTLLLMLMAIVMILQPCLTGVVAIKNTVITIFYVFALLIQYEKLEKDAFFERLMISVSLIVGLIALHTLFTGGVVFYEDDTYLSAIEGMRRGVLGVGIGDPNFSGLLLCAGITCTLCCQSFNRLLKIIIFAACTGAMLFTLSTAGLIAYLLILILNVLVNRSVSKSVKRLSILLLAILLIFQIYTGLPADKRLEYVDTYVERMETKIGFLATGDIASATTRRSDIADRYWDYITSEQSLARQIFGGNTILILDHVPHNTYIDFVLQFGFLGGIILSFFMGKRFISVYFSKRNINRKIQIMLKALYVVFIFSLSVYSESTFALMFVFLFVF